MNQDENEKGQDNSSPKNGALLIEGPVEKAERQEREAKKRDEEYKRLQVRYNKAVTWFTAGLLLTSIAITVIYHDMANTMSRQLDQMETASSQTSQLIINAANQTRATNTLADRMKEQADRTKALADQATIQARAAQTAASAAAKAADIADRTLHVSERAYLLLGPPVDDFPHKRVNIPIVNSGHIPSGPATIVIHEATFRVDDPSAKIMLFNAAIEKHWRKINYQSIPTFPQSGLFAAEVHLPAIIQDQLTSGKQGIAIAATMTYNDGFPKTADETIFFCDTSSYITSTNFFSMRPCEDANLVLQSLLFLDKYPNSEYEEK
jgi:hypothetical protein